MRWPRGGLARIIVDLLYEIGGAPGEPGVTIEQLTRRVMERPPQGMFYAAQRWYAIVIIARGRGLDNHDDIIRDDGAQGITILTDGAGQPWFTTTRAMRAYLADYVGRWARQSSWLIRDGDRYRMASPTAGPRTRDYGIYNAATRARLDGIDRAHAAEVNAHSALRRIDDPALAALILRTELEGDRRATYHERRMDFNRMIDALRKLEPDQRQKFRMMLAERTIVIEAPVFPEP